MKGQRKLSRFRFSIRTLLIGTAILAALLYCFLAEYEFVTTVSTTSVISPNGCYTVRLDKKRFKNINRSWETVELTLLNHAPTTQVAMVAYHHADKHYDASDATPDYDKLSGQAINWDSDSNGCTYQITDREKGRLEFRQNRWELIARGR
jgi:hypothetical protein